MRVLMISPNPLDPRLGASKVTIELAEALNRQPGVTCQLAGPDDLGVRREFSSGAWTAFNDAQRRFLQAHASGFDVVDYDHEHLPYPRDIFPAAPLFVARSVLLVHHLDRIRFPVPVTLRTMLARVVHGPARARFTKQRISDATLTIQQADLVNVSNEDDRRELVRRGIAAGKIAVLPFGLTEARRAALNAAPAVPPEQPVVAFVGTFDFRKGAADFPGLFSRIDAAVPGVRLALFGTTGHFSHADQVRQLFPASLRSRIDIHPRFDPADLPAMLASCSVGVFPSYCEGFGFGVLEMLAAGIPVVAYDAPGPPSMLDREHLVRVGDVPAMASKIIALLTDRERLLQERTRAKARAVPFDWDAIACETVECYGARRERPGQPAATEVTL